MPEARSALRRHTLALGLVFGLAQGCTAHAGDGGGEGGSGSSASSASGSGASGGTVGVGASGTGGLTGAGGQTAGASTLPARTWRLSHSQYENSVADLVGVAPDMTNFAPESGNGKFANFSSTAFVRVDLAANYYEASKAIALELPVQTLATLTSCDLQALCRDTFIDELGAKAFRSPVPGETRQRLASLFELAAAGGEVELGFRAVLAGVLNSPLFLYRKEIGPEADTTSTQVRLTNSQIAEFLSFSLLDAPPPAWLREQTNGPEDLSTDLSATVARLLMEPGFQEQLRQFLTEWLEVTHFEGVEKTDVFPGFERVKEAMTEEATAFLEQSAGPEHGLAKLLLDPVPSVSPALDAFYYSDPSAPQAGVRQGVLGLGAVLASHAKTYLTSPTLRGTFVRKRFFCQEITLPEGFTPPPISETEALGQARSTRELYEQHQAMPSCKPCHDLTDPIGFALESFDGAGRFRTQDTTQGPPVPIDSAADLVKSDVDRPMTGPLDLNAALSESTLVKDCLAAQAFRFYFGQVEGEGIELPALEAGRAAFASTDVLRELIQGLLSTQTTVARTREVLQ